MNFQEIKEVIKNYEDDCGNDLHEILLGAAIFNGNLEDYVEENEVYVDGESDLDWTSKLKEIGLGEIEILDSQCNSDDLWAVILFKDHNIYVRMTGWYDSYGGYGHDIGKSYLDGMIEVLPKEIQTTIFIEKK